MRKLLVAAAMVLGLAGTQAFAQCGAPACAKVNPCNVCKPAKPVCEKACPPKYKYVTVVENVEVEVPVKRWVDKQVTVKVKEKRPVAKEVDVQGWEYVEKEVPCTIRKKVCVPEIYTDFEKRCKIVEETATRIEKRKVPVKVDKVVCRTEYDCDPCTGKKIARKVEETIQVDSWTVECVEVPYTVSKKVWEKVPVERTRTKVTYVEEPSTKIVKQRVPTCVKKTVTCYEFVEVEKTINQPECVVEMVKTTECRKKRVKVQIDPCTGAEITPAA